MEKYKNWLRKAKDDLNWTKQSLEAKVWYGACFTSQQASEKILKAFLIYHKKPLRKIHDVIALLEDCIKINKEFEKIRKAVEVVLPYYVETRYPIFEELQKFTQHEGDEAYQAAEKIIKFVEKKVK